MALRGLQLDVEEGEMFALLGPNGSGKTTLFKIITTVLLPSSGDVLVRGVSVDIDPQMVRRSIGVVFQSVGLDSKLTVWENLLYQGHLYGLQGQILEGRIETLLRQFGVEDRRNDPVEILSGGLQRRVELAKGLLHAPSLLILDEPSTGLDPGARLDLWRYLLRIKEETGATIVFTTHLIDEAERADRVAILDEGSILTSGSPADLRHEIGGDIISLRSLNPDLLARKIKRKFGIETLLIGNELRIEWCGGHRLIPRLAEMFGSEIESVTLQRPTLEDVFVRRTGHHLREQKTGGSA